MTLSGDCGDDFASIRRHSSLSFADHRPYRSLKSAKPLDCARTETLQCGEFTGRQHSMEVQNDTGFAAVTQTSDSLAAIKSPIGTALTAGVLLILYFAYRAILPEPISGIPYNKNATRSPLGDIPEMLRYVFKEKEVFVSFSHCSYSMSF